MTRVTITLDDNTLKVVDTLAEQYSMDRSTTIRMMILLLMKMAESARRGEGAEHGIQAGSGEDTKQP